jgi:tetratricopeptide (TPR) repeat protein
LAIGRSEPARELFVRAGQYPFDKAPGIGLRAATILKTIGYPESAHEILWPMRTVFKLNVDYWRTLFDVANQLKSPALLLHAATKAFELQPKNVDCKNNYAAALLINRTHSEEAVKVTFELISRYPDAAWAKINHALALIHNNRLDEARQTFASVDTTSFGDIETTAYNLGMFEIALSEKRITDAWRAFDKIEKRLLYPNQLLWLDLKKKELPERTASF